MTDEQLQRIHDIEYSCDSRAELAERIVGLEDENAKLRELCIDFASMLTYAGLDGLSVEATIGGITKTYDASELCDKVEEICDKED